MKTHSLLGAAIIKAAGMPIEADWVPFEAMTSDRPYRKAPGQRYAIDELRRHSGTQLDAEVVEALIRRLGATGHPQRVQLEAPVSA